jgi:hypothetical protein
MNAGQEDVDDSGISDVCDSGAENHGTSAQIKKVQFSVATQNQQVTKIKKDKERGHDDD